MREIVIITVPAGTEIICEQSRPSEQSHKPNPETTDSLIHYRLVKEAVDNKL